MKKANDITGGAAVVLIGSAAICPGVAPVLLLLGVLAGACWLVLQCAPVDDVNA